MRIGFDVSQTGKGKTGCGYFADGLIRQLSASDRGNEYVLYPAVGDFFWDPRCGKLTFSSNESNFSKLSAPADFHASRKFWQHPTDDFEQQLGSPDIFHSNNFYCPVGLKRARLVYTLYDLSFLEEPGWTTEQNRIGCLSGVFQASVRADWIVAISESTRRHFLSVFPHVNPERTAVIYPASRFAGIIPKPRPERLSHLLPGGFWLSVGTLEPRKNHKRLIEAYKLLKARHGKTLPLVLAGGQGWMMPHVETLTEGLEPEQEIVLAGYASDDELQWLFTNCFGFIYPSLFEGFGMPVLEALTLGAPVLCSNTTSLPEAGGSAAIYFEPTDADSIARAMQQLVNGEVSRDTLKAAASEQAKRFSWENSAARLRELYAETMARPLNFQSDRTSRPESQTRHNMRHMKTTSGAVAWQG